MASARTLAWIERLVWILIYTGLFMVVLGMASLPGQAATGWSLIAVGAVLAIAGVVLIWVRSRLRQTE
jgi:vacuolar-type H+-ATPase subunit I/STV1